MQSENVTSSLRDIRIFCSDKWAEKILSGNIPPIRGMARMVREAKEIMLSKCKTYDISEADAIRLVEMSITDRTIGDVDIRSIKEPEYINLADELGITIPGEKSIGGNGYLDIRERIQNIELSLLKKHNIDLRIYDVYGVGNPILRQSLSRKSLMDYQLDFPPEKIFVCLGGMDGIDRTIRALKIYFEKLGLKCGLGFPSPGFAVTKWQAEVNGVDVYLLKTTQSDNYKLTLDTLVKSIKQYPNMRVLYLTVTNNPTSYSYSPEQLEQLLTQISHHSEFYVIADLAYVGTAEPSADRGRMAAFLNSNMIERTFFVSSLSKTLSLTGDRFGWVYSGNSKIAEYMSIVWNNTTAGIPRENQLSFMAYLELFEEKPYIQQKIRELYSRRRKDFILQLQGINKEHNLFSEIGIDDGGGLYNWSKFNSGQTVFSLFNATGLAGVPGSAFGYDNNHVRFSLGITPI